MKIVNLTPHALHIRRADGSDIVIEPSGIVPRLEVSRADCDPVVCEDGVEIAVSRATFGALTGMPDPARILCCGHTTTHGQFVPVDGYLVCPVDGCGEDYRNGEEIAYVVSALCAQSPELAARRDVYAPGEALRDSAGKIIGCAVKPGTRDGKLKTLRGGSTGKQFHLGPILAGVSYKTTRNGWAEAIQAGDGEVVACVQGGSPESFAKWVVGPTAEVTAHLRSLGNGEEERARYARLAEEIEAANGNAGTPAALLAHVLGLTSERIAEACAVAGIRLECA